MGKVIPFPTSIPKRIPRSHAKPPVSLNWNGKNVEDSVKNVDSNLDKNIQTMFEQINSDDINHPK